MEYENPHKELSPAFAEFRSLPRSERKAYLPKIEHLVYRVEMASNDGYISEKCAGLISACNNMARLRQPKTYNELSEISWALGCISVIQDILSK